jgi:hypothetical protein
MTTTYQYDLNYRGIESVQFTRGLDSLFFEYIKTGKGDKRIKSTLIGKWFLIYFQDSLEIEHEIIICVEKFENTSIKVKMAVSRDLHINQIQTYKEDIEFVESTIIYDGREFTIYYKYRDGQKKLVINENYMSCIWTSLIDETNTVSIGKDTNIIHNLSFPKAQLAKKYEQPSIQPVSKIPNTYIHSNLPGPGTFLGGKRRRLRKSRKPRKTRHTKTRSNKRR